MHGCGNDAGLASVGNPALQRWCRVQQLGVSKLVQSPPGRRGLTIGCAAAMEAMGISICVFGLASTT